MGLYNLHISSVFSNQTSIAPWGPSQLTDTKLPDVCGVGEAKLVLEAGQDFPLELLHSVTI